MQRGEFAFCQQGNLTATVWKDKRQVTILSTISDPATTQHVQRRQRDGSRVLVPCPEAVAVYNKFMGGVDMGDQLRHYYCVRMKSMKNYKYIFWFIFDVCITNAHILCRHYTVSSLPDARRSMKVFRLTLAEQLIGTYCGRKRMGRPRTSSSLSHPAPPLPLPHDNGPPQTQI